MHFPSSPQPATLSVIAAGERLAQDRIRADWEMAPIQRTLMSAREKYGHALCECRSEPLKLQIRLRDGKLHLAVWPEEGPRHDSECLYFRDELAEAASSVAHLRDPHTGRDGPQSEARPFFGGKRIPLVLGGKATQASDAAVVNVRGLLVRLWDAASLCRWHPNWERDWGRTRFQLLEAAKGFTLNGYAAEDAIFAPRPYRESLQDRLNAEWEAFVDSLDRRRDGEARILIAPVRRFAVTSGQKDDTVLLRHLHVPIALSAPCQEFIQCDCRSSLRNSRISNASDQARPELVGIFSVEGGRGRSAVLARAGWLLPVHPATFIPAPNADTVLLIDELVRGRYAFQHLASEVQPSRRLATDWLVRHVHGPDGRPASRAALELLDRGASSGYRDARAAIAQRMAEEGVPTWTWEPNGRRGQRIVPPLPPHDFATPARSAAVIAEIARSPCVDYTLGPTTKFNCEERKTA